MSTPRSIARRAYFRVAPLLVKDRRLLREIIRDDRLVVLNFHRVFPTDDPFAGPISPRLFADLITYLARNFEVRTFAELDQPRHGTRPIAILSFDDGYRDFLDYALPILAEHGVRANQNVIPSALLGVRPFTAELHDLLAAAPIALLRRLWIPGMATRLNSEDAEQRMLFSVAVSSYLKMRPKEKRAELWSDLSRQLAGVEVRSPTRFMTTADVRSIANVCEVGAHSFEHETMLFESDRYFAADLERCQTFFDQALGVPLRVYAFPNGLAKPGQVNWLLERGIDHVLLVGDRYSKVGSRVHQRFNVAGTGAMELRLRSLGLEAGSWL